MGPTDPIHFLNNINYSMQKYLLSYYFSRNTPRGISLRFDSSLSNFKRSLQFASDFKIEFLQFYTLCTLLHMHFNIYFNIYFMRVRIFWFLKCFSYYTARKIINRISILIFHTDCKSSKAGLRRFINNVAYLCCKSICGLELSLHGIKSNV